MRFISSKKKFLGGDYIRLLNNLEEYRKFSSLTQQDFVSFGRSLKKNINAIERRFI